MAVLVPQAASLRRSAGREPDRSFVYSCETLNACRVVYDFVNRITVVAKATIHKSTRNNTKANLELREDADESGLQPKVALCKLCDPLCPLW